MIGERYGERIDTAECEWCAHVREYIGYVCVWNTTKIDLPTTPTHRPTADQAHRALAQRSWPCAPLRDRGRPKARPPRRAPTRLRVGRPYRPRRSTLALTVRWAALLPAAVALVDSTSARARQSLPTLRRTPPTHRPLPHPLLMARPAQTASYVYRRSSSHSRDVHHHLHCDFHSSRERMRCAIGRRPPTCRAATGSYDAAREGRALRLLTRR